MQQVYSLCTPTKRIHILKPCSKMRGSWRLLGRVYGKRSMAVAKSVWSGALCGKANCFRLSSVFVKRGGLDSKRFTQLSPRSFGLNPNPKHLSRNQEKKWEVETKSKGDWDLVPNKIKLNLVPASSIFFYFTKLRKKKTYLQLPFTKNKKNIKKNKINVTMFKL